MLAARESYSKDDPALGGEGGSSSPWLARLKTLLRYQKDFLGTQGNVSHIISTMVNYFQELRLQEPVVSLIDACLRLHWQKPYEQILHSVHNNCYIRIPASITQKFDPVLEQRQDLFISSCFWNKKGIPAKTIHCVDLSYSCLALAGTRPMLPAVAIALHGNGENGKTMWGRSKVRLFGGEAGGCDFVDPVVLFDKNEFRINMGKYLNFLGLIFDEAGDTGSSGLKGSKKLDASLIKLFIDRRKVIVRPPYAHEADEHAWPKTALYLLLNTFPNIPEDVKKALKAWYRRFLVFPMDGSFGTSIASANPKEGVFLVDDDLDNFVTSGAFTAMYLKRYVQPFLQKNSEVECIQRCRNPGQQLDDCRKRLIADAMMTEESPELQDHPGTSGTGDAAVGRGIELWAQVARNLVNAGIYSFVSTRIAKIVQLGPPKERVSRVNSFLEAGTFFKIKVSRGDRIAYKMPIVDIPEGLKASSFRAGKAEYEAIVDYLTGAAFITNHYKYVTNWACKSFLGLANAGVLKHKVKYHNIDLLGRRFSSTCGAAALPKLVRKHLYKRRWVIVDAVNSDIRIMSQFVKQFLPMAHLPRLDRLAGLDTRDPMPIDLGLGKNKRQIAAVARGRLFLMLTDLICC